MVGKKHPALFQLVRELQKEQNDTEVKVAELQAGIRVNQPRKKIYDRIIQWVNTAVSRYRPDNDVIDYLRGIGRKCKYLNFKKIFVLKYFVGEKM